MEEEWRDVREFEHYQVSNLGRVLSNTYDKVMALQTNNMGIVKVGLVDREHVQRSRSVALLVAEAFVDGYSDIFNCVIHQDGDKQNCRADNLMWRPRWFTVKYHQQFKDERFINATPHFVEVETGEHFYTIREAAIQYGLLGDDVEKSFVNETHCFPTGRNFRRPPERHFLD